MTLAHLHAIRQIVSTWSDKHLYRFHTYGTEYKSSGAQTSHVLPCDLGLIGVAVGQQFHGALQGGKQHRHAPALAFKNRPRLEDFLGQVLRG